MSDCCLGPYTVNVTSLTRLDENTFVDSSKSYRVAVASPPGQPLKSPTPEAVILYQKLSCGNSGYNLIWYECPDKLGRIYTVIPTACSVYVTSFENGLNVDHECNASEFGSKEFCFGHNYHNNDVTTSESLCSISFGFDDHVFEVNGTKSDGSGLFDCLHCFPEEVSLMGFTPDSPVPYLEQSNVLIDSYSGNKLDSEQKIDWEDDPINIESPGVECNTEANISLSVNKETCESHGSPSITTRSSGNAIIAYESRSCDGSSVIKLETNNTPSSVYRNVVYYRSGSRGRIPFQDTTKNTTVVFEVFEDFDISDVSDRHIGFLSGPLAGLSFPLISHPDRSVNRMVVKQVIQFNRGTKKLVFPDSNDLYVEWFLSGQPGVTLMEAPVVSAMSVPEPSKFVRPAEPTPENTPDPVYFDSPNAPKIEVMMAPPPPGLDCPGVPGDESTDTFQWGMICNHYYSSQTGRYLREVAIDVEAPVGSSVWIMAWVASSNPWLTAPVMVRQVAISQSGRHTISTGPISILIGTGLAVGLATRDANVKVWRDNLNAPLVVGSNFTIYRGYRRLQVVPPLPDAVPNWAQQQWHYYMRICVGPNGSGGSPMDIPVENCPLLPPASNASRSFHKTVVGNTYYIKPNRFQYLRDVRYDIQGSAGQNVYVMIYNNNNVLVECKPYILSTSDRHELVHTTNLKVTTGNYWTFAIGSIDEFKLFLSSFGSTPTYNYVGQQHSSRRKFPCLPPFTQYVLQTENEIYGMRLCFDSISNGILPQVDIGFPASSPVEVGGSDAFDSSYPIVVGNKYNYTRGGTVYLTKVEQEISAPKGSEVWLMVLREGSPLTLLYQERFISPGPEKRWYSSSPLTLPVTGSSFTYVVAASCNMPGARFYKSNDTGTVSLPAPWGNFYPHTNKPYYPPIDYQFSSPVSDGSGIVHQRLTFANSVQNVLTPKIEKDGGRGYYLLAQPTLSGPSNSNKVVLTRLYVNSRRTISRISAYLNITSQSPVTIWWYVTNSNGTILARADSVVSPKSGVARYLSPEINYITSATATNYCIGVGWNDSSVSIRKESSSSRPGCFGTAHSSLTVNAVNGSLTNVSVSSSVTSEIPSLGVLFSETRVGEGGCCRSDLSCIDNVEEAECTAVMSGFWHGLNSQCSNITCTDPPRLGACCNILDNSCDLTYESDCIGSNLKWLGPDSNCSQCHTGVLGACCLTNGSCLYTDYQTCLKNNGLSWTAGSNCSSVNCVGIKSACCVDGQCIEVDNAQSCASLGGEFYVGRTCESFTCPIISPDQGCCCRWDGLSFMATESGCKSDDPDNIYQGNGSTCSSRPCEPVPVTNTQALNLPAHTYLGIQVPVANPDVAVAHNHLMVDRSEYTYVVYQAYEENKWNVYLRQIRTLGRNALPSNPEYEYPYVFAPPQFELTSVHIGENIKYVVEDVKFNGTSMCALLSAYMSWGMRVISQLQNTGTEVTSEGCNFVIDRDKAYVVAEYDISGTSPCSPEHAPEWYKGSVFDGQFPLSADVIAPGANATCISMSYYPHAVNWAYQKGNCSQVSLYEDPYCPPPYLSIIYKPEDLWVLKDGDHQYTRVKYHMAVETDNASVVHGRSSKQIDVMFVVDLSGSMTNYLERIRTSIPKFSEDLNNGGADVRYGLCVFGRGQSATPSPSASTICPSCDGINSYIFDGLQNESNVVNGFTSDISVINKALNTTWGTYAGQAPGYSAIQFSLYNNRFKWRDRSDKYIVLITDTTDNENSCGCSYENDIVEATDALLNKGCYCISFINPVKGSGYASLSRNSGWAGDDYYNCESESYTDSFNKIKNEILLGTTTKSNVIERDVDGFEPTFIRPASIIVTYEGDLSEYWISRKSVLEFRDAPPVNTGSSKGLTAVPFSLTNLQVYGLDPVHINGNTDNWVFFLNAGPILLAHPHIGTPPISRSYPLLIGKGFNPKVLVNNRNEVFVAYETYSQGSNQIVIKGTGDFAQNSITGPKASRITKFVKSRDFAYEYQITIPSEGVNQLCDFVIDKSDVVHVAWQSNRDGNWEIYYANGLDMFNPIRITKSSGRSVKPSIDVDSTGNIYIAYQDNRFGRFQTMLAYKTENRVKPLLEQDAYHASLRSGYQHVVDLLPVWIEHPRTKTPLPGEFWVASSNVILPFNTTTGDPKSGGGSATINVLAIAGSYDGYLYGITDDPKLVIFAKPAEGSTDVDLTPEVIGTISVNLNLYDILDATVDPYSNSSEKSIWLLLSGKTNDVLTIVQISCSDARIMRESSISSGEDLKKGSLTATSDSKFHLVCYKSDYSEGKYSISEYPLLTESGAFFDFKVINSNLIYSGNPVYLNSITSEIPLNKKVGEDTVYGVTTDRKIVTFENGVVVSLVDLDSAYDADACAFQFSGQTHEVGTPELYHVLLKFYDNQNKEGSPYLVIDSRSHLEAFIPDSTEDLGGNTPFTANGLFLDPGHGSYIYFNAAHYRPGMSKRSFPYGFETNRTYFVEAYSISKNGELRLVESSGNYSFSCSKCTKFGDNSFDKGGCSYSFVVQNSTSEKKYYCFRVKFYVDDGKKKLIRQFIVEPEDDDLAYVEIDNKSTDKHDGWTVNGLLLDAGEESFVQVYPALDAKTGFLCGLNYHVEVLTSRRSEVEV